MSPKRLYFTVTNDLNYDQRMIRICSTLANEGYRVTLIGRRLPHSPKLVTQPFRQKRLYCFFTKGKLFYAEYSLRLFFYLFFRKMDGICAIDLDTILPCYYISRLKRAKRIYDAHELFCEMKEVVTRPRIYRLWKKVEKFAVPRYPIGYTVNEPIAEEFAKMYGVNYGVIRNLPLLRPLQIPEKPEKYILYQGAVNEGRSFETLIPAMREVPARLLIAGDGNFMDQARKLVKDYALEHKVIFTGKILPTELQALTKGAWIGTTLFENKGLSNYLSLANRFFDYMNAGIPQLCVDYPAYNELNKTYPFAVLISDLAPGSIASHLNRLLQDEQLYQTLQKNCLIVRDQLSWQEEEKKLRNFYNQHFHRET